MWKNGNTSLAPMYLAIPSLGPTAAANKRSVAVVQSIRHCVLSPDWANIGSCAQSRLWLTVSGASRPRPRARSRLARRHGSPSRNGSRRPRLQHPQRRARRCAYRLCRRRRIAQCDVAVLAPNMAQRTARIPIIARVQRAMSRKQAHRGKRCRHMARGMQAPSRQQRRDQAGEIGPQRMQTLFLLVGRDGFEPSTKRLKVFCSTD